MKFFDWIFGFFRRKEKPHAAVPVTMATVADLTRALKSIEKPVEPEAPRPEIVKKRKRQRHPIRPVKKKFRRPSKHNRLALAKMSMARERKP